jgi:hypothetical protein
MTSKNRLFRAVMLVVLLCAAIPVVAQDSPAAESGKDDDYRPMATGTMSNQDW